MTEEEMRSEAAFFLENVGFRHRLEHELGQRADFQQRIAAALGVSDLDAYVRGSRHHEAVIALKRNREAILDELVHDRAVYVQVRELAEASAAVQAAVLAHVDGLSWMQVAGKMMYSEGHARKLGRAGLVQVYAAMCLQGIGADALQTVYRAHRDSISDEVGTYTIPE